MNREEPSSDGGQHIFARAAEDEFHGDDGFYLYQQNTA
jgi:hypothetical protein